jgi:hypothetical protein
MEFAVGDELAALIERLAKPRPFENLSFNAALWKVIREYVLPAANEPKATAKDPELEKLLEEAMAQRAASLKKAPTPSPTQWVATVPDLKQFKHLTTWKAICDHLDIETAGDSARRKLKNWVPINKPKWPPVPDID